MFNVAIVYNPPHRTLLSLRSPPILHSPLKPHSPHALPNSQTLQSSPLLPTNHMPFPTFHPLLPSLPRPNIRHNIPRPNTNNLPPTLHAINIPLHNPRLFPPGSRHPLHRARPRSRRTLSRRFPDRHRRRHQSLSNTILLPLAPPPPPFLPNLHRRIQASHRSTPNARAENKLFNLTDERSSLQLTRASHITERDIRG